MTRQKLPLISVITPAYNAARTLLRAHESVCAQTVSSWEHIIIDDGSTDQTYAVAKALDERDRRVRVVRTPNRGPGAAVNLGISMASGDFIAFLDADDEYLPHHIELRAAALVDDPTIEVLWGGFEVVADRPEDLYVPDIQAGAGMISVMNCIVQGTIFCRGYVFESLLFNEDRAIWWHDYEFVQRAKTMFSVERFAISTYRYYRNSGESVIDRVKGGLRSPSAVQ